MEKIPWKGTHPSLKFSSRLADPYPGHLNGDFPFLDASVAHARAL